MKKALFALAVLGAVSALCLKGMKRIGEILEQEKDEKP